MQRKFTRNYESLEEIFEFAESFFEQENIDESIRYPVHFAMEELFTNMVKYNPGNTGDILLECEQSGGTVAVRLTDFGAEPFDVTASREADTDSPLEERRVGGLGLHLVRQMVDSLEYDHAGRRSTITFTKGVERTDV